VERVGDEPPAPDLRLHAERRRDREAEPRLHQLLDGLGVPEFHGRARRRPRAPEPIVDDAANGTAVLEQDQRLRRERGWRHRPSSAPRAARGRDRDELVGVDGRDRQLPGAHGQAHDADVQLVLDHGAADLGRVAGHHHQLDIRIAGAEAPQRGRQQIDADGRAGPEAHAARHHAAQLADPLDRQLELAEGAGGVGEEQIARLGGERALADALEHGEAELALELPDLHAHRGLRQVEGLGGAGEAAVAGHRLERAQVDGLEVHGGEM